MTQKLIKHKDFTFHDYPLQFCYYKWKPIEVKKVVKSISDARNTNDVSMHI